VANDKQLASPLQEASVSIIAPDTIASFWRALQRAAGATVWPTVSGGCHPARDTRLALEEGGFQIERVERFGFRVGALDPPRATCLGSRARSKRP
jgi:hypothetical protein